MIKTKAAGPSERLRNASVQQPHLHNSSRGASGARCHDDFSDDIHDLSGYSMIELRSGLLSASKEQAPEVFGANRREEEAKIDRANENSFTIIYKSVSFRRSVSELSEAKDSRCSIECKSRAEAQTSVDDRCSCMYSSLEGIGTTKRRSLYIKTDGFRPVIHPLDSTLLMSPPSPLEL